MENPWCQGKFHQQLCRLWSPPSHCPIDSCKLRKPCVWQRCKKGFRGEWRFFPISVDLRQLRGFHGVTFLAFYVWRKRPLLWGKIHGRTAFMDHSDQLLGLNHENMKYMFVFATEVYFTNNYFSKLYIINNFAVKVFNNKINPQVSVVNSAGFWVYCSGWWFGTWLLFSIHWE